MGGARLPTGSVVGERVVHVDAPYVIAKYDAALKVAIDRFESASAVLKSECKLASEAALDLQAQLDLKTQELENLKSVKVPAALTLAPAPSSAEAVKAKEVESYKIARLKEELGQAYSNIVELKKERAMLFGNIPEPEIVIKTEFKDRIIMKMDRKLTAAFAGFSLLIGGSFGHYLKPNTVPVAPQSAPILQIKKAVGVKK